MPRAVHLLALDTLQARPSTHRGIGNNYLDLGAWQLPKNLANALRKGRIFDTDTGNTMGVARKRRHADTFFGGLEAQPGEKTGHA